MLHKIVCNDELDNCKMARRMRYMQLVGMVLWQVNSDGQQMG
jgi:hypothetical protein